MKDDVGQDSGCDYVQEDRRKLGRVSKVKKTETAK
jgi:hypothetical protein